MDKVMLFFLTTCGMALVAAGFAAAWLSAAARARRAEGLVGEEHQFFGRLVSRQVEQRPDSARPSIPTGATPH
ncbi:MAG: hypothetical protein AB7L66_19580 [Gemmatimonadales bacterium]